MAQELYAVSWTIAEQAIMTAIALLRELEPWEQIFFKNTTVEATFITGTENFTEMIPLRSAGSGTSC